MLRTQLKETPPDAYRLYVGTNSVYTHTFTYEKKEECPACGGESTETTRPAASTLQELMDWLLENQGLYVFPLHHFDLALMLSHSQIKRPSLSTGSKQLYMQGPPQLEQATRPNLEKPLSELIKSGETLTVTDSALPFSMSLSVTLG